MLFSFQTLVTPSMQVRNQFSQQPKVAGKANVLLTLKSMSLYDTGEQTLVNDHKN
jgi:hypothetical protein